MTLVKNCTMVAAATAMVVVAAITAGCGGSVDDNPKQIATNPPLACSQLVGMVTPATAIGLPTTGAAVSTATIVPAAPATATTAATGEYCKVQGLIHPLDPSAENITFQLNLPTTWNQKALQVGGGSLDGVLSISDGTGNIPVSIAGSPTPLARGFATFGSDSGHQGTGAAPNGDGSFGLNSEEEANFAGDALKKTHDVAVALITARYGMPPKYSYFAGGSTGGREAFAVLQRYPQDYNGIFAAYSGYNQTELYLQHVRVAQALYSAGGWLDNAKATLLYQSVLAACDSLDGAKDGIVSNPGACHFDPTTIRCPGGVDTGDTCLSDPQIATVNAYHAPFMTSFTLSSGQSSIGGYNIFEGSDFTGTFGKAAMPIEPSNASANASTYISGSQFLKYFVVGDATYNALNFDTVNGTPYVARLDAISTTLDAASLDIAAFEKRGGKLLFLHGTADAQVPTQTSIDYYNRLVASLGQSSVDSFVRFYLIPGFGHGAGTFLAGFDALTALDNWVVNGTPPTNLAVQDNNAATRGRSRPLCIYPQWPKYTGSGDINAASSFVCATL